MAFFELKPLTISMIALGIAFVVGVLVIVALKMFHQNREDKQVKLAEKGMALQKDGTYKVGADIALGKYIVKTSDETLSEVVLMLNGEEKTFTVGAELSLQEDDEVVPLADITITICK